MTNRTFSEQLIEEWLNLDGWLVKSGVPLESKTSGGRDEADLLAFKRINGKIHVKHIEVGAVNKGSKKDRDYINEKFRPEKQEYIRKYTKELFGVEENPIYSHRYIAIYANKRSLELIRENNHQIDLLSDVIEKEILDSINKWKNIEVEKRRTKQKPTIPNNLWMIQLIDSLKIRK